MRKKVPKLQSNWKDPYKIVKKLSEVVFKIRKLTKCKCKIVHADRLAQFM